MEFDDISITVENEGGRRNVFFGVPRLLAKVMRVQDLAALYGWQMGDQAMLPVVAETYDRLNQVLAIAPYTAK